MLYIHTFVWISIMSRLFCVLSILSQLTGSLICPICYERKLNGLKLRTLNWYDDDELSYFIYSLTLSVLCTRKHIDQSEPWVISICIIFEELCTQSLLHAMSVLKYSLQSHEGFFWNQLAWNRRSLVKIGVSVLDRCQNESSHQPHNIQLPVINKSYLTQHAPIGRCWTWSQRCHGPPGRTSGTSLGKILRNCSPSCCSTR